MKKKLVLFLCLLTCLFAMSACSSKKEKASFKYDENAVKDQATQYMDAWNKMDFSSQFTDEAIKEYVSSGQLDKETGEVYKSWRTMKETIGNVDKVTDTRIEESKDKVTVIMTATYQGTKNKVEFSVPFDASLNVDTNAITIEEVETLASKLEFAGVNTILGMGTVFVVLIFISLIISLFVYIPKLQEMFSKKNKEEATVVEAIDNTVSQIVEQEEEELVDDGELVAVITAAIMASMGDEVPADGLVVRSIKRAKTNKWQKA